MRKGKKIRRYLFAMPGLLAALLICTGAVGAARPSVTVTNRFDSGAVDIELQEYSLDEAGREIPWKNDPVVLPGAEIPKIVRIKNRGDDCYLRVKATLPGDDVSLAGIGGDWSRAADGYYYYREILETGETVDFLKGVRISDDLDQETEGRRLSLDIQAEAIQSRNVTPEWEQEQPWGEPVIQKAEQGSGRARKPKSAGDESLMLEYQGDAARIVVNTADFFQNLPSLLPGDSYEDQVLLANDSNMPTRLFFRSLTAVDSPLASQIGLTIETEAGQKRETIYQGPLSADELAEEILLVTIPAYGSDKLLFTLTVPQELDNPYGLQSGAVQWIFSSEETVRPREPENEPVNTGDGSEPGSCLIPAGLSLAAAVFMAWRRKKGFG